MNEICYYDKYSEELKGSILSKAKKFVRLNRVQRTGHKHFAVLPIIGYNSSTYEVNFHEDYWTCNCQANRINNKICSHIIAVSLYLKTREGAESVI